MAGHFDFGNDLDVALSGVRHDVADLSLGVEAAVFDRIISEHLPKNKQLFEYIRRLKSDYKISILSNIAVPDWFREHFTEAELGLFDDLLLSSQVGLVKPDPEIFRLAARRLGVDLNECLFIDDREPNVAVAESLGMSGLVYKNFKQLKKDLSAILSRNG